MENKMVEPQEVKDEGLMWDGEENKYVNIDPELKRKASNLHTQLTMGSLITAVALHKIYEERLYLALGCSTKKEYVDTMLTFGERQAQKYVRIGKRFSALLPENASPEDLPKLKSAESLQSIADLGMEKIYEISKIEDADFQDIADSGVIKTKNGEVSIEDIKAKTYREAAKQIKELRKKSTAKITALEEKNKTLKAEKESMKNKVKQASEKLKTSKELEDRYGDKKSSLEEKRRILESAREHLNIAGEKMANINVELDDPQPFKADAVDLYKKINLLIEIFRDNYGEILIAMEDYQ